MPRRLLTTIALLLMLAGIAQPAISAPGAPPLASSGRAIEPPEVTAQAVFSFDLTTGITLYEKNPHERMQVGSTVKIATALVVMKHGNTDDQVLVAEEDTVDIAVYSNMQLQAGDTLTVGTLLYGLLIPSGNDAALALARHVGMQLCECENRTDAISAFVGAMNDEAEALGLENTRFTRPDGLDSEQAYSTAHDMARLFGEFMKVERLRTISGERAYQFTSAGPEKRQYAEDNTNRLLGQDGVIGGKTGTTPDAGACVVLAREMNGGSNTVITAVFGSAVQYEGDVQVEGSDKRWDDARAVFAAMDDQFAWVTPGAEGTFPGLAEEMAVWQVEFQNPPSIPYPRDGVEAGYQLVLKPAAGEGGDGGSVRLYYDKEEVGSVPVYYRSASTVRERG